MPGPSRVAFTSLATACALAALPLSAQDVAGRERPALQADVLLALGIGGLVGGPSRGMSPGPGTLGLGVERALGASSALRFELVLIGSYANINTGAARDPKVSANLTGIGVAYRRYLGARQFVGGGATIAKVTNCEANPRLSKFDPGAGTYACKNFSGASLSTPSVATPVHLSAGLRLRRFTLGLRVDATPQAVVRSDQGDMSVLNLGILGEYRFGRDRRATPATRVARRDVRE